MSDQERPNPNGTDGAAKNGNGNGKRRVILIVIATVFVLAGIAWYLLYVFVFSLRETTDDAYVNGNQVGVSSQVPGTVTAVLADDTQLVQTGPAAGQARSDRQRSRARQGEERARQCRAPGAPADRARHAVRRRDRQPQDRCSRRPKPISSAASRCSPTRRSRRKKSRTRAKPCRTRATRSIRC